MLRDFENVEDVNKQLERLGYNMGMRIIEDFLSKTNSTRCTDMRDTADKIQSAFRYEESYENCGFFLIFKSQNVSQYSTNDNKLGRFKRRILSRLRQQSSNRVRRTSNWPRESSLQRNHKRLHSWSARDGAAWGSMLVRSRSNQRRFDNGMPSEIHSKTWRHCSRRINLESFQLNSLLNKTWISSDILTDIFLTGSKT